MCYPKHQQEHKNNKWYQSWKKNLAIEEKNNSVYVILSWDQGQIKVWKGECVKQSAQPFKQRST